MSFKLDHNLDNYFWESRCCMGCANCKYGDWIHVPADEELSWICPEWQWGKFDNWGATGRTRLINAVMVGDLDYSDPLIIEAAFRCFNCGACDVSCKRNLDLEILMMNQSLKVALVEQGYGPMPAHKRITAQINNTGNYYGYNQADRKGWITDDIKVSDKADVLFFVGCTASFEDQVVAQATARIMNKAGVDFMLLDDEVCCGNLMYNTGQLNKFKGAARLNLKKIKDTGAKTVVCACGDCFRNIKVEYPKVLEMATADLGFEVLHIVELADKLSKDGKIKAKATMNMKMTYHDACSVGRLSEPWIPWVGDRDADDWSMLKPGREFRRGAKGCYDPPRDLISGIPGVELVEMGRHHSNNYHAGEGGGVKEAFPDTAQLAANMRMKEAGVTGATALVTPCVHSKETLSEAMPRMNNSIQKIYHIAELVDETYE